jgi:hypothetical protein
VCVCVFVCEGYNAIKTEEENGKLTNIFSGTY